MFGKLCSTLVKYCVLFFVHSILLERLFGVVAIISHCDCCDEILLVFLLTLYLSYFSLCSYSFTRSYFISFFCVRLPSSLFLSLQFVLCVEKKKPSTVFVLAQYHVALTRRNRLHTVCPNGIGTVAFISFGVLFDSVFDCAVLVCAVLR